MESTRSRGRRLHSDFELEIVAKGQRRWRRGYGAVQLLLRSRCGVAFLWTLFGTLGCGDDGRVPVLTGDGVDIADDGATYKWSHLNPVPLFFSSARVRGVTPDVRLTSWRGLLHHTRRRHLAPDAAPGRGRVASPGRSRGAILGNRPSQRFTYPQPDSGFSSSAVPPMRDRVRTKVTRGRRDVSGACQPRPCSNVPCCGRNVRKSRSTRYLP